MGVDSKDMRKRPRSSAGDSSARSKAREQLQLTEENYRTIFENSAVAITVSDAGENIITWNKFAEVLLRMGRDELYMKPVSSLYPEAEWKRIRSQNVRQKGMQHHFETKIITGDQEIIDVDLSLSVLKGPEGKVNGSIGIIADITERKKAEEALRQSEELSRGMIETAETGIYLLQDGRFQYVNRLLEEICGYSSDELIGTYSLNYVHPEDREMVRAKAIEVLKGQSNLPYEFRSIRKDWETVWLLDKATSIEYQGRRAVLGTLMDITERKMAEAELIDSARQVETLYNIGVTVSQTLNLTEMLESVLERVLVLMEIEAGGIFLVNAQTDELVLNTHQGFSESFIRDVKRMKVGKGFAGRVALTGKPLIVGNMTADARFDPIVLKREGFQSLSAIPIMSREKILGVLSVCSYGSRNFLERELQLLGTIANQIGVAVENSQLYERTVEIAFTDSMTGLYNRRYLMEQIEREFARASRSKSAFSVIMIDLDGLKTVNDRFGHHGGDAILKELGRIIKADTRTSDVAGRLGGDEFMLLASETDSSEACDIGERIRSQVEQYHTEIDGEELGASISVGVASYPSHASDVKELLQRADEAMYNAKRSGKNQVCLATPLPGSECSNAKNQSPNIAATA